MTEFEEFSGADGRRKRLSVTIVPMADDDVEGCARLAADREGDPVDRWRETFQKALDDDRQMVFVARHGRTSSATARRPGWDFPKVMECPRVGASPASWWPRGLVGRASAKP